MEIPLDEDELLPLSCELDFAVILPILCQKLIKELSKLVLEYSGDNWFEFRGRQSHERMRVPRQFAELSIVIRTLYAGIDFIQLDDAEWSTMCAFSDFLYRCRGIPCVVPLAPLRSLDLEHSSVNRVDIEMLHSCDVNDLLRLSHKLDIDCLFQLVCAFLAITSKIYGRLHVLQQEAKPCIRRFLGMVPKMRPWS